MNRANWISLGVFFLVSIGMIPNSHAKSFQCNLKLDTFHLPSIAGCQMSLVNGKLVESYTSFFGNNQSLELDICPTDPQPPVKAKTVAKKLIKIPSLKAQGNESYWIEQLQGEAFYAQIGEVRADWRQFREMLEQSAGEMSNSALELQVKTSGKNMEVLMNGELAAKGNFSKAQGKYELDLQGTTQFSFAPSNEAKTFVISSDGGTYFFKGGC